MTAHLDRIARDPHYAAGARDERARCARILAEGDRLGHHGLAKGLALDSDMDAETAARVLGRAPVRAPGRAEVAVQATDFAAHCRRLGLGPAGSAEDDDDDRAELAGLLARARGRDGRR